MSSRRSETRTAILEAALATLEADPRGMNVGRVAQLAGCSRQAVYLHFANRAVLLLGLARYVDERFDLERHLAPQRAARNGEQLLGRLAEFLATYNPLIYPVVRAADAVRRSDPDVGEAWNDRLRNRRRGSRQIGRQLADWGCLAPRWTPRTAGDWLTAQSSVKVWEELVIDLGYSRRRFVDLMTAAFTGALLARGTPQSVTVTNEAVAASAGLISKRRVRPTARPTTRPSRSRVPRAR